MKKKVVTFLVVQANEAESSFLFVFINFRYTCATTQSCLQAYGQEIRQNIN